jgi:hypothetical protein
MHLLRNPIVAKRCRNRNRLERSADKVADACGVNTALTGGREACKIRGASMGEKIDAKLGFEFMYGARAAVLRDRAAACQRG